MSELLTVASYNIHKGVSAFGRRIRIHELREAIDQLDADLVFLQEVQGQHDRHANRHAHWPQSGQHEFLAGLSHQSVYGKNAIYRHGHHGNALLSRLPIHMKSNVDVSDHAFEQRGILHVVVEWNATRIHCFVIHLGLFASSRRRQIDSLIDLIGDTVAMDSPLIIAGDFNDWSQSLSTTLYRELGVNEAFDVMAQKGLFKHSTLNSMRKWLSRRDDAPTHAKTFPARLPLLCLDRLYVRGLDIVDAQVLQEKHWKQLSDHVPILAQMKLDVSEARS